MNETKLLHALGRADSSEEFAAAAGADTPDAINEARLYAQEHYEEYGSVMRPQRGALRALWDGNLRNAYSMAGTNLAIVLESAFSDAELGLDVQPSNNYGYKNTA